MNQNISFPTSRGSGNGGYFVPGPWQAGGGRARATLCIVFIVANHRKMRGAGSSYQRARRSAQRPRAVPAVIAQLEYMARRVSPATWPGYTGDHFHHFFLLLTIDLKKKYQTISWSLFSFASFFFYYISFVIFY